MTRNEMQELLRQFGATFPNFQRWFSKLEDPAATAEAWFPSFENVSLLTCQRIIPLMRDEVATYEPLAAFDYENFPRKLPRYARRWEYEEQKRNKPPEEPVDHRGAWIEATEGNPVMSEEFRWLLSAQQSILRERPSLLPKELNEAALRMIGGIQLENRERVLKKRVEDGILLLTMAQIRKGERKRKQVISERDPKIDSANARMDKLGL